ncbi:MAG: TIGR00282 family metallophosphoesterase [Clostridiales bacterium]|nr:TIGR00282 family metallophosphoesterase [Clostridiales bacterium]
MKILTVGDVVSKQGRDYLRKILPGLKKEFSADITIVNGENAAVGNGITPDSADDIFTCGADVITLGNHALRRQEIYDYLDENKYIIRPANFHSSAPGNGIAIIDKGYLKAAVINLQGAVYSQPIKNPFDEADCMIDKAVSLGAKIIVVDFHAEATSEKRAIGFYLDGRVSVVFGTHTHVQTSDNQILPHKTGYITDVGMTGPLNSVLGVSPECVIKKLRTGLPVKFKNDDGKCTLEGCFFEIDNKTGETVRTEIFRR